MLKSGGSIFKQLEKTQNKLKGDACTRWGSKVEIIIFHGLPENSVLVKMFANLNLLTCQ